ncbi:N5-glutamine S-adenosyl-L-methionine-dependent methyltransferase [Salinisphaera dokdonensis CL-ES53]|uniref:Release factor glutamine methyltransferase n=1 Tax=Salinisphaera dokdonensis CL-ES53 TaxID=1304272 RepID=A0ABV2B149_9GAMM
MPATIDSTLRDARARLAPVSDSPDIDARRLLEHVLGVSGSWLIVHARDSFDRDAHSRFEALLERRLAGEPLAYVTGRVGFWTLDLDVTADVLVPRPDTETLVEAVLEHHDAQSLRLLDLGTGSGAIALALASERPNWAITATDASKSALACAQANAERLTLDNVTFTVGPWYAPLEGELFDVIVSNPPYVAPGDLHLDAPALQHEPQAALIAEDNGLADLERIITGAPARLNAGGAIYLEHGNDQGAAVRSKLIAAGFEAVATRRDLGGNDRVTHGLLARATS